MKRFSLTLALAAALAVFAGGALASSVLTFSSRVEVNQKSVTLADLLDQELKPGREIAGRLASVHVAYAPPLGKSSTISGRVVRARLAKAQLGSLVSVLIPAEITLVRISQFLTPADLTEIYSKEVMARLNAQGVKADVHGVAAVRGIKLPQGQLTTLVRFARPNLLGVCPAMVEINVDGRRVGSVRVVGTVDVYGPVVVAARTIAGRQVIDREDVKVVEMNLANAGPNAVSDPEELVGMRARTRLNAGRPIDSGMVEKAPLIKRGQVVTMICQAPGLKVTARGQAMQTGYKNSPIRLKNLSSKRMVQGTVLDSGTVIVRF